MSPLKMDSPADLRAALNATANAAQRAGGLTVPREATVAARYAVPRNAAR